MQAAGSGRLLRERLLDAVESLYIESGREQLSIRHISERAEVNLAMLDGLFATQEAILHAMLMRRLDPVNQGRLASLACIEQTMGAALRIEHVLGLIVCGTMRPEFDFIRDPNASAFALRVSTDLSPTVRLFVSQRYRCVERRFMAVFSRLLPGLALRELELRIKWSVFNLPGIGINASVMSVIYRSLTEQTLSHEEVFARFLRNALVILDIDWCASAPSPLMQHLLASNASISFPGAFAQPRTAPPGSGVWQ